MPNILAIKVTGQVYEIVSRGITIPLGDADRAKLFLDAMKNNRVVQYFGDLADAMPNEDYGWEEIQDTRDYGATVQNLLQENQYFVFDNSTRFVAPIGDSLESALADSSMSGINPELEPTGITLGQVLDDIIDTLA